MRILVVDDEPSVRAALQRALRLEGYEVEAVGAGEAALASLARMPFDGVVLDVLLPGIDGIEVCRRLRAAGDVTPVLMLTAADAVQARVAGLDAGSDDYLVKPFALEELLARLRALLRRGPGREAGSSQPGGPDDGVLRFADLEVDTGSWQARRGGRELSLTRTEMSLLELFLTHPRQVLTRTVIFDAVWGYDFGPTSNSLEVYVGYLRRKTEAEGETRLLHTVRGVGYVLRET
ncbi:MAG: response regulator transcription factor [Acidimicrobiales bacterium]